MAGGAVFGGARAALLANLDGALLGIARAELASALDSPDGKVHLHEDSLLVVRGATGYEKYALIRNERGDPTAYTANLRLDQLDVLDAPTVASVPADKAVYGDIDFDGQRLRAIHYPFRDRHGVAYTATCAVPYAPMDQALRLLAAVLLLAADGLWGGSDVGSATAGTAPDQSLGPACSAGTADRRGEPPYAHPPLSGDHELVSLTDGLNTMLNRLDTAFTERQAMIEAQRQFLMDASHELRTPVSNLRGTLEVALRRPRTEASYRETLEHCLPEVERLSTLVDDLLTLARSESGGVVLQTQELDLAGLVTQALQAHQAQAASLGVTLCYEPHATLMINGDPTRLRQVLDNLLSNALRFAPTETAIVAQLAQQGNEVTLTVRDHGPGVAPDELPQLFERFWRADSSRNRATGGLGLGLAISRTIVEAHGGQVSAESTLGEGACFTVRLPLATCSQDA